MTFVGSRVIRGPDWPGGNEDGGEGSLGTVTNAYDSVGKVKVMWDFGGHGIYKAGTDGKHELLLYDNGPSGVIHSSVTCDGRCQDKSALTGIRWKCRVCVDFDLCTTCFMAQFHEQDHKFLRQTTTSSTVCSIGDGNGKRITLHGILPGASVTRGVDWESGDDDGGKNNEGVVEKLTKWGSKSYKGSALVQWSNGRRTNYRVGGEGCVDLLCIGESKKHFCVPAYLPVLDILHSHEELKLGDKVQMIPDVAILKQVLEEIDNWDPAIEKYVGKEGAVVRVRLYDRFISVQYENTQTWHLLRSLLIKKHSFKSKEFVRILNQSTQKMENLQQGHGNWVNDMEQTKGQIGQIIEVCDDGDLKVKVKDREFYYSPVCCSLVDKSEISSDELEILETHSMISSTSSSTLSTSSDSEISNFDEIENETENALARILLMPLASQGLVAAAAQNDINGLKAILSADKSQVDIFKKGKTALQMACSKGHYDIVKYLLSNGADINLQDEEGDAPIHFAADGKHVEVVKLLHSEGADINLKNKKNQTAFHLAVIGGECDIVEFLLKSNCDINTQDEVGDSPLHDAVDGDDKDKNKLITVMLSSKNIKVDLINNNGISPVHLAVMNRLPIQIFQKLVAKKDNMDSLKTSDGGHTPLHVAAINANNEHAMHLLKQKKCDVNAEDFDARTPLQLAVIQKSEPMVDLLLSTGANINHQDKDGNTAAHLSALDLSLNTTVYSKTTERHGYERKLDVTYVLTQFGADLEMKNKQGKTVFDLVSAESKGLLKRVMLSVKKRRPTKEVDMYPVHWIPMESQKSFIKVQIKDGMADVTDEYREVVEHFSKTGNKKPVKVERIQNIDRWEAYSTKKKSMQRISGFDVNEKLLFHGTKPDVVNQILHQGLDMRLVENGLYGNGCYFATESRISDGYAVEDENGFRYMFVCKVLVGKYTQGVKYMRKPPAIDCFQPNIMYDSAVDREDRPSIFVIFDNTQCYPEYLITYI